MKVIIVGAGISGLSVYLLLHKYLTGTHALAGLPCTVKVLDAYDVRRPGDLSNPITDPLNTEEPLFTPAAIGNAIGITKNGLMVLKRLDGDGTLYREIIKRGHRISSWQIGDARGWTKVDIRMSPPFELEDNDTAGEGTEMSIMIARQELWEVLRDAVLGHDEDAVVRRRVTRIVVGSSQNSNVVHFSDGSQEQADLVIGADGLKSVVRKTLFPAVTIPRLPEAQTWIAWVRSFFYQSKLTTDYFTPRYESLVGVGGFVPSGVLRSTGQAPGTMAILFGPNGFFGCGYITSDSSNAQTPGPISAWWSTFSSDTATPYALDGQSTDSHTDFNARQALADLLARHRSWKQPVVQAVLDHVVQHGITHVYPTYTTPELPTWQKHGRVVLIGDAAHALQPSSGQGASQCLEDAEALSLLLKHFLSTAASVSLSPEIAAVDSDSNEQSNGTIHAALEQALTKFVGLRRPRVHKIFERSQKMSRTKMDMGFVGEMLMYLMLRLMKYIPDNYNDEIFNYDISSEVTKVLGESNAVCCDG